ncbi:hypothetical protein BDR05DRAFT_749793 [Suillus weaverae]|nr:hypothetical protein BDR05DRAFT_749793 [Suillus weaverae]
MAFRLSQRWILEGLWVSSLSCRNARDRDAVRLHHRYGKNAPYCHTHCPRHCQYALPAPQCMHVSHSCLQSSQNVSHLHDYRRFLCRAAPLALIMPLLRTFAHSLLRYRPFIPRPACASDAAEVLSSGVSNSSPILSWRRGLLSALAIHLYFELRPLPAQLVSVFSFANLNGTQTISKEDEASKSDDDDGRIYGNSRPSRCMAPYLATLSKAHVCQQNANNVWNKGNIPPSPSTLLDQQYCQ